MKYCKMIKLVKGDIKKLEGKVTSFSRLDDEVASELADFPRIIALYGCTNPLDLFEKAGIPPEETKGINRLAKEAISDISKKFNEKLKEKGVEIKLVSIYATPVLIENENDLHTCEEDVIDTGSYHNLMSCIDATKKGIDFYFLNFEDCLRKKHNIHDTQEKSNEVKKTQSNYKNIEKGLLKSYILNNFVTPILDCRRYGEEKNAEAVRLNFFKFCEGSSFVTDALKVSELMDAKHKDLGLINDYLDKIEAINSEEYLAAAKIRDKIAGKNNQA